MISPETVRAALAARPFRPFVGRLVDGRGLDVPGPEYLGLLGRPTRVLVVYDENDSPRIVAPDQVDGLEFSE